MPDDRRRLTTCSAGPDGALPDMYVKRQRGPHLRASLSIKVAVSYRPVTRAQNGIR